jgi:hypothetical protein
VLTEDSLNALERNLRPVGRGNVDGCGPSYGTVLKLDYDNGYDKIDELLREKLSFYVALA